MEIYPIVHAKSSVKVCKEEIDFQRRHGRRHHETLALLFIQVSSQIFAIYCLNNKIGNK